MVMPATSDSKLLCQSVAKEVVGKVIRPDTSLWAAAFRAKSETDETVTALRVVAVVTETRHSSYGGSK